MQIMTDTHKTEDEEFQKAWMKVGLLTAIPTSLIFILGFLAISDNSDKRAFNFSQLSKHHEIAVKSYRNCNRTIFVSKEQCIAASVQLAEQSGAKNTEQLTSDLLKYADQPSPTAWEVFKEGLFYFSTEE